MVLELSTSRKQQRRMRENDNLRPSKQILVEFSWCLIFFAHRYVMHVILKWELRQFCKVKRHQKWGAVLWRRVTATSELSHREKSKISAQGDNFRPFKHFNYFDLTTAHRPTGQWIDGPNMVIFSHPKRLINFYQFLPVSATFLCQHLSIWSSSQAH